MAPEPAASCVGVWRSYRTASGRVDALRGVDVDFASGAITAVVGPSGSGKSSLLRLVASIDRPDAGRVVVGGNEVSALRASGRRRVRRRLVGYVFQQPAENLFTYLTAAEHLALAARLRGVPTVPPEAGHLLSILGLEHRAGHQPHEMSGGEQQRLAFACAVIGAPAVVVADEPTAELDRASAERLVTALVALRDDGASVVVSAHDPVLVAAADHLVTVRDGSVVT